MILTENHTRTRKEWEEVLSTITAGYIPYDCRDKMYDSGYGQTARLKALEVWKEGDRILDLACGNGRLAIALTDYTVEYDGLDCISASIEFCKKAFSPWEERMRFYHNDVWNGFYNPAGAIQMVDHVLPFADELFDSVFCSSIFTHVGTIQACEHYIREVSRVLKPGGKAWVTWFRSPPNEVNQSCDRTVFKECDIMNMVSGFKAEYTNCGFTNSYHDQWEMVLSKHDHSD